MSPKQQQRRNGDDAGGPLATEEVAAVSVLAETTDGDAEMAVLANSEVLVDSADSAVKAKHLVALKTASTIEDSVPVLDQAVVEGVEEEAEVSNVSEDSAEIEADMKLERVAATAGSVGGLLRQRSEPVVSLVE